MIKIDSRKNNIIYLLTSLGLVSPEGLTMVGAKGPKDT